MKLLSVAVVEMVYPGLVFLALRFLPIDPVFLAIGFSVFLVSIVIETTRSLVAPPQESDESDESAA